MADVTDLKLIEQEMLLAIMRLHPNAYGVSIRDEIKTRINKEYSFGSIYAVLEQDRKSTRLNSSHIQKSRMPSSA